MNAAANGDLVLARIMPPRPGSNLLIDNSLDGAVVGKVLSILEKAPQAREITGTFQVDQVID